mmetsp:Transcript_9172/g.23734  ORF Transcript_9172/g.23734 Transcript_9172/m.23734 type:complete len:346 (-) Transcript_9172:174-1211(-)
MEVEMSYGWIECVGIADRSAFDLTCHAKATGRELSAKEKLAEPIEEEVFTLSKKAAAMIGKDFKKDAKAVQKHLDSLAPTELAALCDTAKSAGSVDVSIDGASFTLTAAHVDGKLEMKKVHERTFVPNVVEPSFGIDRLLTAIYEHSFYIREGGDEAKAVLRLSPQVAPYKALIVPLDARVTAAYGAVLQRLRDTFAGLGVQYKIDESGASVGKRYARNDELGIPFGITVDFDTLDDKVPALYDTVTLRERDSMAQLRVPIGEVCEAIQKVCTGAETWTGLCALYPTQEQAKAGAGGSGPVDAVTYLRGHQVEKLLNAAVNDAVEQRPSDPIKFIAERLAALPPQ